LIDGIRLDHQTRTRMPHKIGSDSDTTVHNGSARRTVLEHFGRLRRF
jgi:hypothetical protein